MATDKALIEKRKELKRRLAAGEHKTLVDVFLSWFNRLLQKAIRQAEPFSVWQTTTFLGIVVVIVSSLAIVISGDLITINYIIERFGLLDSVIIMISAGVLAIISPVITNQYIRNMFVFWRDEALDVTLSLESLNNFEDWLKATSNKRLHLLITITGGVLAGLYLVNSILPQLGFSVGFSVYLVVITLSMFSSAFLYLFLVVLVLLVKIRHFDLKLFKADPSNTELIVHLSSQFNLFMLFVAFYAALLTLMSAWSGLVSLGIFLVVWLWIPIIAMFIINQTSLSSLIRRAKWKMLNEIQAKVEILQSANDFESKEKLDTINRLLDYHERIKGMRNSSLNLRTVLSFINSLLLPLLAFILGNLDLVLSLFTRQP